MTASTAKTCGGGLALLLLCAAGGCRVPGEADYGDVFVGDRVVTWDLQIASAAWSALLLAPSDYVEASFTVDGERYERVGLRMTGNTERTKKSLRVRFDLFDPAQDFHGVKRVNLRAPGGDPSLIREALALELFAAAGVPAPRRSLVWLGGFGGGAGGVFTLVEQLDRKFLRDRFGEDGGDLFELEEGADLSYAGDDAASYDPALYQLQIGDPATAHEHVAELAAVLARTPPEQLEAAIEPLLAVDGLLRAIAVNTWLANLAAYPGSGGNLYLYRDVGGRFHYIPWDLNQAFGNYHGEPCNYTTEDLLQLAPDSPTCGAARPLVDRLLAVPALGERYRAQAAELVDTVLHPTAVLDRMRELQALVSEVGAQDGLDDFTAEQFAASFVDDTPPGDDPERTPGLEGFIAERDARFRSALGLPVARER